MSRPGVFLLIAAGIALGGYIAPPPEDTSRNVTEITRISISPERGYRGADVIPSFAPATSSFREAADKPVVSPVLPLPKPGTWTTVVTAGRSVVSPVRTSNQSPDPATRSQLARDLQRELQRVGCYAGEINGSWTQSTRRAMSEFMDRANAVLPVNNPDYVLLALVQSHDEVTCADECPAGQLMQDDGRCLPTAVVAQAAKHKKRLDAREFAQAQAASNGSSDGTGDRLAVVAPRREVLPWQRNEVANDPLTVIAIAPRPNPIPGRMSIGGPVEPTVEQRAHPAARAPVPPADAAAPQATAKVAALQPDPDANDLADDSAAADSDVPPISAIDLPPTHTTKKSRRSESERRRDSYAYAGKRRRSDPRPGTARYNLMQSLGGIY